MRPPLALPGRPDPPLAPVIPLAAGRRAHPSLDGQVDPDPTELDRAGRALHRRAGERGMELPPDLGRRLAALEARLAEVPTALDTERVLPALAVEVAGLTAAAGALTLELVPEETEVLAAALGAPLDGLRLDALHRVADAVLAVSRAPRAAERWGDPRAAEAAEAVVTAAADDLREAARTHEWLYAHFTDRVWDIPGPVLERGRRRWRLVARTRLRHELRLASRTGHRPGSVAAAASGITAARTARARVAAVGPLLIQHLGALHRGPLSNADDALHAVRAIRQLQAALGDRLDADRLGQLIRSDAFRTEDVFGPAVNLRMALGAWQRDVDSSGGTGAWSLTIEDLASWVRACTELLPDLRAAHAAATEIGAPAPNVRALVDLHLLREHVAELIDAAADAGDQEVGS